MLRHCDGAAGWLTRYKASRRHAQGRRAGRVTLTRTTCGTLPSPGAAQQAEDRPHPARRFVRSSRTCREHRSRRHSLMEERTGRGSPGYVSIMGRILARCCSIREPNQASTVTEQEHFLSRSVAGNRGGVAVFEVGDACSGLELVHRQRNPLPNGPPDLPRLPLAGQKMSPNRVAMTSVGSPMICRDWECTIGDVRLELKRHYPTLVE